MSGNWLARLDLVAIGARSPLLCFFLQRVLVRLHIFMAGCYRCVLILGFLVSAIMRCLSTALLMTLAAAQDPAEGWMAHAVGSLPSSVERITRLEMTWTVGQTPTWSWAFFSPWFGMDPADNLNLIQPVNPWSGSAWSMYTEYYQWSPEHNSNSRSYTVQAGRSVGVQRRGRFVHPQPDGCGDRRDELSGRSVPVWKEVCRAVRCLREGVLLLHVPRRWQGQLPKHYCRVRRHGLHASPAYTTPGTIPPFWSAAPAAVVATPSAVVVPAPALSYSLCFPTVSAAPAPVQAAAPVATLAPRVTSVPVPAVSYTLPQTRSSPLC